MKQEVSFSLLSCNAEITGAVFLSMEKGELLTLYCYIFLEASFSESIGKKGRHGNLKDA
jgi:hypothetical protein